MVWGSIDHRGGRFMPEVGDLLLCTRRVNSSCSGTGYVGTSSDAVCEIWAFLRRLLLVPHLNQSNWV